MLKCFLFQVLPVFVLAVGLSSCNRENPTDEPDVYQPSPPTFRTAAGAVVSLNNAKMPGALDLHDEVDLSASVSHDIKVTTNCQSGGMDYFAEEHFGSANRFQILRAVPEKILLTDLEHSPTYCTFVLDLYNANGSRHLFHFPLVNITDKQVAAIGLHAEPNSLEVTKPLLIPSATNLRLRASPEFVGELYLLCSTYRSKNLAFRQVLDLSLFDFGELSNTAKEETCRAVLVHDKERVGLSSRFKIYFKGSKLQVQDFGGGPKDDFGTSALQRALSLVRGAETLPLNSFLIQHSGAGVRHLRLSREPRKIKTILGFSRPLASADKTVQEPPFLQANFVTNQTNRLLIRPDAELLDLYPGESVRVDTYFLATEGQYRCKSQPLIFKIEGSEQIQIEELGPNNEVLDTYILPRSPTVQIGLANVDFQKLPTDLPCSWN